uniref:Serine/threonine-protein phosphatase 2A 55 kDa regulatory subunit B n=1 Tax=Oryctolagus cuniculus TaxID=9986 RepID=G1TUP4_RABIT
MPTTAGSGQSQEPRAPPGLPHGWQGPKYLSHRRGLSGRAFSRKRGLKPGSRGGDANVPSGSSPDARQLPHKLISCWLSPLGAAFWRGHSRGCSRSSWVFGPFLPRRSLPLGHPAVVVCVYQLLTSRAACPAHNLVNCFCILLTADIISTVEFNCSGDLLATGDKGGRVVIFQREQESKSRPHSRGEYNVYSTFQSHEPEFDYLKSLEIEEKINKIRWLPQQNAAHFLLSTNDKTIKLWKISERDKRAEGYNLKDEDGRLRGPFRVTALRVPILKPMDLMVEASPRRIFANAHTYHINSISVNSDHETYLSADDLRINLWHLEITDRSFNIVDIKPANMEELTEVITAAEFHPHQCNVLVYSSSKGTVRLCDMRSSALCDRHAKFFEEPEDPSSRSFFSEIISSISDVKFSHSGRYMMTRDYLSVKVWDLNMESRPVETHQVHEYLRSKLCSLYENDCIFDKFECCWNGSDSRAGLTRHSMWDQTSQEASRPAQPLPRHWQRPLEAPVRAHTWAQGSHQGQK